MDTSVGHIVRMQSSVPAYNATVEKIVTSTMVDRMQILARPAAFCFIRYISPETVTK